MLLATNFQTLIVPFQFNVRRYHLRDIVVGKIYFLLVRIKIKHMEIAIIKKETSGSRKQQLRGGLYREVVWSLEHILSFYSS